MPEKARFQPAAALPPASWVLGECAPARHWRDRRLRPLLGYYDEVLPFDRSGQYALHRRTIDGRFDSGSVGAALSDCRLLQNLYSTLLAWGIGLRASKLAPFPKFCAELRRWGDAFDTLDGVCIDDPELDIDATRRALWGLVASVDIVGNQSRIVALSKTIHHLLPDLLPPIDRMYTQVFFGLHAPHFQYRQEETFAQLWRQFAHIAAWVDPAQYVGAGWRTSRSKVIDNAIVAFVHQSRRGGNAT